jgi:hypothetical protein
MQPAATSNLATSGTIAFWSLGRPWTPKTSCRESPLDVAADADIDRARTGMMSEQEHERIGAIVDVQPGAAYRSPRSAPRS